MLAVCGSIAAYKTAFFVRLLVKAQADVKVIMTKSATDFITPLTLSTLSKKPVYVDFFDRSSGKWTSHVELGLWADAMVVAPASANTIAKMSMGICDNLLLATYLSARCPVFVSPAMDLDMYRHPATQGNLEQLKKNGNFVIDAKEGELASGLDGAGRMAEPEELVAILENSFMSEASLKGKSVMITSGPTHELIDPVRFIGNHSSGKMGKALAEVCAGLGAQVHFISGPVNELPQHSNIEITRVSSADEMFAAAKNQYKKTDIAFFSAAVSDYRPKSAAKEKHKRNGKPVSIDLVENPDIAFELGKLKSSGQINIGFALETENETANAISKMNRKNFDMIVLNSLKDENAGFAHDTNKITIFDSSNNQYPFELKDKREVAKDIVDLLIKKLNA